MIIVVTRKSIQYSPRQFLKVESLKQAASTVGNIEFLVYNESTDTDNEKSIYIDQLRSRVGKFIYIRDPERGDDAVKLLMPALNGIVFDDEYFLEDEEELLNMLECSSEIKALTTMNGVAVVNDFFQRYMANENGKEVSNKAYLSVVKNAVRTMVGDYDSKNKELIQMSKTATELFTNTSKALAGSDAQIGLLKKQMEDFEEKIRARRDLPDTSVSVGPAINYFPQIRYLKEKRIIRIKELGNVPFLTSFTLGLRLYLENVKNVKPKLIVIWQKGSLIEKSYSDFNWITQSTMKDKRNFYGQSIVFTNHPSSDVINELLKDDEFDTFIILDRSLYDNVHLVNSKGDLFYAVGSPRYIKKFRLSPRDCFSSTISKGNWAFYIDYDENYPAERVNRERFYMQTYKEEYEMML